MKPEFLLALGALVGAGHDPIQKERHSKHRASTSTFAHKVKPFFRQSKKHIPTNHERVVAGRAKRLGVSVEEYKRIFSLKIV